MALRVGIRLKTTSPISELEDLLEARCKGKWDVELDSLDSADRHKTVAIRFETQRDCDAFIAACKL